MSSLEHSHQAVTHYTQSVSHSLPPPTTSESIVLRNVPIECAAKDVPRVTGAPMIIKYG